VKGRSGNFCRESGFFPSMRPDAGGAYQNIILQKFFTILIPVKPAWNKVPHRLKQPFFSLPGRKF
jgi:hypothetical protein